MKLYKGFVTYVSYDSKNYSVVNYVNNPLENRSKGNAKRYLCKNKRNAFNINRAHADSKINSLTYKYGNVKSKRDYSNGEYD